MNATLDFQRGRFNFTLARRNSLETHYTVIIGPNGVGKSRLLGSIAESADDAFDGRWSRVLAVSNLVSDPFKRSDSTEHDYRYLGVRTGNANSTSTGSLAAITIDSILQSYREGWRLDAVREAMTAAGLDGFHVKEPSKESRASSPSKRAYSGASANMREEINYLQAAAEGHIPTSTEPLEWAVFLDRMQRQGADFGLSARQALDLTWRHVTPRPDLTFTTGDRVMDARDLSVGQLLLVSMIARIAANVSEGALVLVDEPETGLHPTWQSEVIPLIGLAAPRRLAAEIFVATHSPHVVADADTVLIPGPTWGGFVEYPDEIEGRSIENLLYRVFRARVSGNRAVEEDLLTLSQYIAGTGRGDLVESDRAAARLASLAASDTPVANKLLEGYRRARLGGHS